MSLSGDGQPRFRLDALNSRPKVPGGQVSGRAFVFSAVAILLAAWGVLSLTFSNWREGVEQRIAMGKAEVLPAIDPLATKVPPGIEPGDWNEAVEATRELLRRVIGTGRLDEPELLALRDQIAERSDRARPETALTELSTIWDEQTARLGRLRGDLQRPGLLDPPVESEAKVGERSP